jgi:hypothetical protein
VEGGGGGGRAVICACLRFVCVCCEGGKPGNNLCIMSRVVALAWLPTLQRGFMFTVPTPVLPHLQGCGGQDRGCGVSGGCTRPRTRRRPGLPGRRRRSGDGSPPAPPPSSLPLVYTYKQQLFTRSSQPTGHPPA